MASARSLRRSLDEAVEEPVRQARGAGGFESALMLHD